MDTQKRGLLEKFIEGHKIYMNLCEHFDDTAELGMWGPQDYIQLNSVFDVAEIEDVEIRKRNNADYPVEAFVVINDVKVISLLK